MEVHEMVLRHNGSKCWKIHPELQQMKTAKYYIWFHTIVCCLAETCFHKNLDV